MTDQLVMPRRSFDDLHDEVLRRSARFRAARRCRAALASAAVASVVALVVSTAGGPMGHTVSTPAGPGGVEDVTATGPVELVPAPPDGVPPVPVPALSATTVPTAGGRGGDIPLAPRPPQGALRTWVLFQQGGVLYEVDPTDRTMRVAHASAAPDVRWSPNGRSLVLAHEGDLRVADAGGAARVVFDGSDQDAAGAPVWLPDGSSLLFVRTRGLIDKSYELWTVEVATGSLARVRPVGAGVTPAVGPDGRIAYQCPAGVCLTDRSGADGGSVSSPIAYAHLAWSPDGRWIAATGSGSLVAFRPDGTGHRVVVGGGVATRPVWFADSSRLAYERSPSEPLGEDSAIWSVALDSADARLVVAAPTGALMDARP